MLGTEFALSAASVRSCRTSPRSRLAGHPGGLEPVQLPGQPCPLPNEVTLELGEGTEHVEDELAA